MIAFDGKMKYKIFECFIQFQVVMSTIILEFSTMTTIEVFACTH